MHNFFFSPKAMFNLINVMIFVSLILHSITTNCFERISLVRFPKVYSSNWSWSHSHDILKTDWAHKQIVNKKQCYDKFGVRKHECEFDMHVNFVYNMAGCYVRNTTIGQCIIFTFNVISSHLIICWLSSDVIDHCIGGFFLGCISFSQRSQ